MPTTNQQLLDAAIRHAVHNQRYGRGLAAKIVKLLNAADADLVGKIADRLSRDLSQLGTARISDILESIRFVNDSVYRQIGETLTSDLIEFAALEAEFHGNGIERAVAIDYRAKMPSPQMLRTLVEQSPIDGHLLSSWTSAMSTNRLGRIEQQLRIGIVQGETVQEITKRVRGILPVSRRSAETLTITAVSTVSNQTKLATYRENSDVIKGVQFTATLDTRTSSQCQSHDGEFYPIDKVKSQPPLHPRCRSVLVGVAKSWKELGLNREEADEGVRASMDGQVPASTTYGSWLKQQSAERQDDVLGKERGKLFREGKLSFEQLYRDDGTYASLEELRRKLRG